MAERITVHYEEHPIYDIIVEKGFEKLPKLMREYGSGQRTVCIVTDTTVGAFYLEELSSLIEPVCRRVVSFSFPAGEEHKNLDTVNRLYRFLIEERLTRRDLLIALGGGVVGDLTGFAAATYLRGIDFIQIPTTLLSMVDSSIGGKTGVDFESYKNMVGAFYNPRLVYMNLAVLKTLTERQYISGIGEIIKHGLIRNEQYYEWLISNREDILRRELGTCGDMILGSCNIKCQVVESDWKERGDRALLNFGHTLGHAIEKEMKFTMLHGECVAVGAVAALYLSFKRGMLDEKEFLEARGLF